MEPLRADDAAAEAVSTAAVAAERPRTRRDEIVEAAARYFAEHGYANAGMRDIAEAVGMRGASLYNHFHSKEEILFAIALRMTEDPQQDLLVLDGEGGPVQRLTALVEAHVRRLARYRVEHLVALRELSALTPEHRRVVTDYRKYYQRRIRDVIEAGARMGVFEVRASVRDRGARPDERHQLVAA